MLKDEEMNMNNLRSATVALLALGAGLGTSTAFAQVGDAEPSQSAIDYAQPYGYGDQQGVSYNRMGHFSCGFNELHTRLERKNCGGGAYARY